METTLQVNKMAMIEKSIGKKMGYTRIFMQTPGDDFAAFYAAQAFITKIGYSMGSMQREAPIGVAKGDADISKWRNLGSDVRLLDGALVPEGNSMRDGNVVLFLAERPEGLPEGE